MVELKICGMSEIQDFVNPTIMSRFQKPYVIVFRKGFVWLSGVVCLALAQD